MMWTSYVSLGQNIRENFEERLKKVLNEVKDSD